MLLDARLCWGLFTIQRLLPPLATSRNLFRLHHLASPKWTLSKNTVTNMSKRNRKIAKFMIPWTLSPFSLRVDWVDPARRHSEPASWSSRSAPMSTAPHMFAPRSSQAGSCRVNFLWKFVWKFGRIVHKRWQEMWSQERISSYEKLHFLRGAARKNRRSAPGTAPHSSHGVWPPGSNAGWWLSHLPLWIIYC